MHFVVYSYIIWAYYTDILGKKGCVSVCCRALDELLLLPPKKQVAAIIFIAISMINGRENSGANFAIPTECNNLKSGRAAALRVFESNRNIIRTEISLSFVRYRLLSQSRVSVRIP